MSRDAEGEAKIEGWAELVAEITASCCGVKQFLERHHLRRIRDRSGWTTHAERTRGYDEEDQYEHLAGVGRDRALSVLAAYTPPGDATLRAAVAGALASLEALPDARQTYSGLGVALVVERLVAVLKRLDAEQSADAMAGAARAGTDPERGPVRNGP